MGAVGGVAILGGNFEAATFPEDKVVQRSLTAGTQESSPIDAIILDALPLGAPGQLDSHAFIWKGHSNDGSPHTIDWKLFVDVTADDGTGSVWTLQTRIDAAPYGTVMTIDDNGLLTVSGATFTMDQLIIDSDNTEAVLIRKDGDAGDVFIVDTVNDVVRLGSNDTFLTFGASSDARLERFGPRDIGMREPGVGGVSVGAGGENTLRLYARDDVAGSAARFLELTGDGPLCLVKANRAAGGGQFDLFLDVSVGKIGFFNEGVQRWNIQGSVTADFEFAPFITNRYDLGSAALAVRNLYTNGVLIGQDKTSAYDAIIIDATALGGDGQQDSGAIIWTGKGFETATPHDIDWKAFVNVTADDGTGSIWTLQARIDGASFVDEFTITATTSPTLVRIGPGSTGGALGFGPPASAAQAGTVRFQFTDDIRYRNEGDDGDFIALSFGESSKMILGEAGIPFIEVPAQFIVNNEFSSNFDGTGAFAIRSTTRTVFNVDTTNHDIDIVQNVERLASVVDRFKILGRDLTVNSTVGFSGAILLEGQAREAGGSLHDATWRMYVEPLTTTAFDGQSVFKITAEIDTGGPTTVFTLTDTGDLIVPGSFTIDGLIIDVSSPEAFLVRKDGDSGDVFIIDTDDNVAFIFGQLAIGTNPASSGSIRLPNSGDIAWRNAANDDNIPVFSFASSDIFDFGDSGAPTALAQVRIFSPEVSIPAGRFEIAGSSTSAFRVVDGSAVLVFAVDTTNDAVRLSTNDTFLAFGASSDAQMHRGDGADIIEQRRGANSQKWNIYDNFVSFSDYDRLGIYIGGGPPVISATIKPESTDATQGINLTVESLANAFGDGSLTLRGGTSGATFLMATAASGGFMRYTGGEFQVNTTSGMRVQGLILSVGGSISTAGIGMKIDIAGQGAAAFEDSHSIDLIGAGENANRATWRTFVDVTNVGGDSIWTLQNDKNGGGFVTNLTINNDGDFNLAGKVKIAVSDSEALFIQKAGGGGPGQDILKVDTSASGFPPGNLVRLIGASFLQETASGRNTFGTSTAFDYVFLRIAPSQVISGGASDEAHILLVEGNIQGFSGDTARINVATFTGSVTTQNVAEAVANISQVQIDEPAITLQGSSTVTHAQSLLITGAPTEGDSNFAFRILAGDIEIDNSSAFLFDDGGGGSLSALSVAPTNRLEIGLSGTPWARINLYSQIINNIGGDLRIVATAANHSAETQMQVTFADVATSAGSSVTAASLIPAGSFVIGVTVRVLTTVTGPTGFDVGDGIDVDRWGNSILVAAGTVTNIQSFTSGAVTTFPAANDVVITSDGVDFTGGSIRITVHYTQLQTSAA